ncbi:MAG: cell envelope integrity EipB family protein [Parvibaculum sp.]
MELGFAALRGLPFVARNVLSGLILVGASPAHAIELASHRAVYDLELERSKSSADIGGLSGRMVLEWVGTSCEGYTLNQRLVTQVADTDGGVAVRDLRLTTWESGDGDEFRFELQQFLNGALAETISGEATRDGSDTGAVFTQPQNTKLALPQSVIFPSEFLRGLVSAALAGRSLETAQVFEGAETDRFFEVSSFIGKERTGTGDVQDLPGDGKELVGARAWSVQVSYFNGEDLQGLPEYQVSYQMFANGVSSDMLLDYGDLVIKGRLVELDYIRVNPC